MPFDGQDRREHPRLPYNRKVEIGWGGMWHVCQAPNLSFGGMFVALDSPPPEGTQVELRLTEEGIADALVLTGLVVRFSMGNGVGISFTEISADSQRTLEKILDLLVGERPDDAETP